MAKKDKNNLALLEASKKEDEKLKEFAKVVIQLAKERIDAIFVLTDNLEKFSGQKSLEAKLDFQLVKAIFSSDDFKETAIRYQDGNIKSYNIKGKSIYKIESDKKSYRNLHEFSYNFARQKNIVIAVDGSKQLLNLFFYVPKKDDVRIFSDKRIKGVHNFSNNNFTVDKLVAYIKNGFSLLEDTNLNQTNSSTNKTSVSINTPVNTASMTKAEIKAQKKAQALAEKQLRRKQYLARKAKK